MSPDRLGYWRIIGLTTEGETITLIRDCSPYWCWTHLADDAANRRREADWEWFTELRLDYLWSDGWGRPRRGYDERYHLVSIVTWRQWIIKGFPSPIDNRGWTPVNTEELNEAHRRFMAEQANQTIQPPARVVE